MKIFIKDNHSKSGLHRFLEGLTVVDSNEIVLIDSVKSINKLDEEEIGIFGGFTIQEILDVKSIRKKYYNFCSPLAQAELSTPEWFSAEISLLKDLLICRDKQLIENVVASNKYLSQYYDFVCFPHVKIWDEKKTKLCKDRFGYGFLGNNIRKHKNVANQVAAMSALNPRESIFVKDKRYYQKYWGDIFLCNDCFIDANFYSDKDYYDFIKTNKLGFQCSHSESFSYMVLEYALMGVPCLFGPCVDWMKSDFLLVKNVDNWLEIASRAQHLLNTPSLYWELSEKNQEFALDFNNNQIEKLKEEYERFIKHA